MFTVVLHGQDGFSAATGRGRSPPRPQAFLFGVCAAGRHIADLRRADPATVPKAMDVITPLGVDQTVELDPTLDPVLIEGVAVP